MGYDLHITRGETWLESDATPITFEEWEAYVPTDSSPRPDEEAGCECVLWTGDPKNPSSLFWDDGEIRCKNPDEPTAAKLVALATLLDARVLGDDGEEYFTNAAGAVERREPPPPPEATHHKRRNSWWLRLIDQLNGYRPED
jgi:hypothetical protein